MTAAPAPVLRCAVASAAADEPLAGSAPRASSWLVLEQPGPWGAKALTQSHLDPDLGRRLGKHVDDSGVRVLLSRRPGHHADDHREPVRRTVWLASTRPGSVELRRWVVDDTWLLLDLDVDAIARGELPDVGEPDDEPLLLLCTNAKRDRCCAIEGRPAVAAAALAAPGRVWECSHLGGHRFAPTGLLLPHGYVLGRLAPDAAARVVAASRLGLVDPSLVRGRSTWTPPAQAAEVTLRRELRLTGLNDVTEATAEATGPHTWTVRLRARGEDHVATVRADRDPEPRPESCGGEAGHVRRHHATLEPRQ